MRRDDFRSKFSILLVLAFLLTMANAAEQVPVIIGSDDNPPAEEPQPDSWVDIVCSWLGHPAEWCPQPIKEIIPTWVDDPPAPTPQPRPCGSDDDCET